MSNIPQSICSWKSRKERCKREWVKRQKKNKIMRHLDLFCCFFFLLCGYNSSLSLTLVATRVLTVNAFNVNRTFWWFRLKCIDRRRQIDVRQRIYKATVRQCGAHRLSFIWPVLSFGIWSSYLALAETERPKGRTESSRNKSASFFVFGFFFTSCLFFYYFSCSFTFLAFGFWLLLFIFGLFFLLSLFCYALAI